MTLAHELAHAVLHHSARMFRVVGATGLTDLASEAAHTSGEHQAKVFAATTVRISYEAASSPNGRRAYRSPEQYVTYQTGRLFCSAQRCNRFNRPHYQIARLRRECAEPTRSNYPQILTVGTFRFPTPRPASTLAVVRLLHPGFDTFAVVRIGRAVAAADRPRHLRSQNRPGSQSPLRIGPHMPPGPTASCPRIAVRRTASLRSPMSRASTS